MSRTVSRVRTVQLSIPLSKLVASRRNPRRARPEVDAHQRLVASIRSHGLLQPLVVHREGDNGSYHVIAGGRRLAALREVYRNGTPEPVVPCVVRVADEDTARALSLAENFVREPMHPLDEADAFARLARDDAKGVPAIAAEFGVSESYVRQRMKLATLAEPVKTACREGVVDIGTAEAFASIPPDRQHGVWQEVGGRAVTAGHVRSVIEHAWISADHAIFDTATLPEGTVSRDLFADRVLIERKAFMEAQTKALEIERQRLIDDGWSEVVAGPYSDLQARVFAMEAAPVAYDEQISAKLQKLSQKREQLEAKLQELDESDRDGAEVIEQKLETLDNEEAQITKGATVRYAEAVKSVGTAFVMLCPEGRVRREYRIPRSRAGVTGSGNGMPNGEHGAVPTSDDLRDGQRATAFTHQALAVREALLGDTATLKRVLALILYGKVRSNALSIRHDTNSTTVHAENAEGFASPAMVALRKRRNELDPLRAKHHVEDYEAYAAMKAMPDKKLDAFLDLLAVESVTAHLARRTELVFVLAADLGVDVRKHWRPDERWLAGYQKIQLSGLISELRGSAYAAAAEQKKKSELVTDVAKLFADAAEGRMEDRELASKLNAWLPSNLRSDATTVTKKPSAG